MGVAGDVEVPPPSPPPSAGGWATVWGIPILLVSAASLAAFWAGTGPLAWAVGTNAWAATVGVGAIAAAVLAMYVIVFGIGTRTARRGRMALVALAASTPVLAGVAAGAREWRRARLDDQQRVFAAYLRTVVPQTDAWAGFGALPRATVLEVTPGREEDLEPDGSTEHWIASEAIAGAGACPRGGGLVVTREANGRFALDVTNFVITPGWTATRPSAVRWIAFTRRSVVTDRLNRHEQLDVRIVDTHDGALLAHASEAATVGGPYVAELDPPTEVLAIEACARRCAGDAP